MRLPWVKVDHKSNDKALKRRKGEILTERKGEKVMRNSSRDWSYATTFQGMPAFTSSEERGREWISPSLGKEEI